MALTTIVLLIISLFVAAGLSYYQYFYKNKLVNKTQKGLFVIRFLAIFGILLLIINPKFTQETYQIEKPFLPIYLDNSSSVKYLKEDENAQKILKNITSNSKIQDKFDVQIFSFDSKIEDIDSLNFAGKQTNIAQISKNNQTLFKNKKHPTILISDGNQTVGNEYGFAFPETNSVYPIVLGDTTQFIDLRIAQLNVNKYAFLNNKFPVEVFTQYNGSKNLAAELQILHANKVVSKSAINFSQQNKAQVISIVLPAEKVGTQIYQAKLVSKEVEKNQYNNLKNFAVEVIDQKSEIAIISDINHPDLGVLKRSIATNKQRNVTIIKPQEFKAELDYNAVILYQPTASFKKVYDLLNQKSLNTWTITGKNTDFNFLNKQQPFFTFKMSHQMEDYLPLENESFNAFSYVDFALSQMPPLQNLYGNIESKVNSNVLLWSKIRNIDTNMPLLTMVENGSSRHAFLFGENIWKWRLYSNFNTESFEPFDLFLDKIVQYLSTKETKKALVVTHENFYNSGDLIEIDAQFFDKNFEFSDKANLSITVTNIQNKASKTYDLLKGNQSYKVNLDGLLHGKYQFVVTEKNSKNKYSSSFEILDFDIEKQFINPDAKGLNLLAQQTNGKLFYPNQVENLMENLLKDNSYQAIEKAVIKKTPLIDMISLLILIAILLAMEWFIRKYNGML